MATFEILDGFNIYVEVKSYVKNAAELIFNSARTTWPILLDVDYDPTNKVCQGLVEGCLTRDLNPALLDLATIQLEITGMTRVGMAQITRQRSAVFNVTSQYTDYENWQKFTFVRPRNFKNKGAFEELVKRSIELYNELADSGVPPFEARYVLPAAVECGTISWNTTPNQIASIASFRLCNSCSPDENNLMLRKYIETFSELLKTDLAEGSIDSLTYKLYMTMLNNTDALGFRQKKFSSFNSIIGNSGRFPEEAERSEGIKKLQNVCRFNTVRWSTTSFKQELETGKYILLPGERSMLCGQ